jgi:cytochrome c-type protein NapB
MKEIFLMRHALLLSLLFIACWAQAQTAPRGVDPYRRGAALNAEPTQPSLAPTENKDLRRKRAYPMQPPTIPHAIDGYQVDQNSNRCMLCHARANADEFKAPMVSVTHYMDRDGQFLGSISPQRYFCTQCHIPQTDAKPLVGNSFKDIDELLAPKLEAKP